MVRITLKTIFSLTALILFWGSNTHAMPAYSCSGALDRLMGSFSDMNYSKLRLKKVSMHIKQAEKLCSDEESIYPLKLKLCELRISRAVELDKVEADLLEQEEFYAEELQYDFYSYAKVTALLAEYYELTNFKSLAQHYAMKTVFYAPPDSTEYNNALTILNNPQQVLGGLKKKYIPYNYSKDIKKAYSTNWSFMLMANDFALKRLNRYTTSMFFSNKKKAQQILKEFKLKSARLDKYDTLPTSITNILLLDDVVSLGKKNSYFVDTLRKKLDQNDFYISRLNKITLFLFSALKAHSGKERIAFTQKALDELAIFKLEYGVNFAIGNFKLINYITAKLLDKFAKQNSQEACAVAFSLAQLANAQNLMTNTFDKDEKLNKLLLGYERERSELDLLLKAEKASAAQIKKHRNELSKFRNKLLEYHKKNSDQPSLAQVQKSLGNDDIVFYSTDIGSKTSVFYITAQSSRLLLLDRDALNTKIKKYRAELQDAGNEQPKEKIFSYIEFERANKFKNVLWISNGILDAIPPSTLFDSSEEKWMVQTHQLKRFISLESFLVRRKIQNGLNRRLAVAFSPVKAKKTVAMIDDDIFDDGKRGDKFLSSDKRSLEYRYHRFSLLSNSDQEAKAIVGQKSKDRIVLSGLSATKDSFLKKTAGNAWDLISMSTHTCFPSPNIPLKYPSLVFRLPKGATGEKAFLTSAEIAKLNLKNSWIVLAACDTANALKNDNALGSLLNAFYFAGAKQVLATHWQIDNLKTVKFMTGLAKSMTQTGHTGLSKMLQDQQLKAMNEGVPPSIWGAWDVYN